MLLNQYTRMALLFLCGCAPLHGVQLINVTQEPVYFSVFYKKQGKARKQIKSIYTAESNGDFFVKSKTFSLKDPALKISTFSWPAQKCVEFTQEELIALGVGVGVGAVALGAAAGAAAVAGAAEAAAANVAAANTIAAIGGGAAAEAAAAGAVTASGAGLGAGLGAATGSVGAVFASGDLCKAEHYPRTALFSFDKKDIETLVHDWKNPQGLLPANPSAQGYVQKTGSALHRGDNVDGGEIHFVFYNPYGFDAHYAAYGRFEKREVAKAGKLNSTQADPLIPNSLRHYLRFANYFYFGQA